jgi:hypothetical protein
VPPRPAPPFDRLSAHGRWDMGEAPAIRVIATGHKKVSSGACHPQVRGFAAASRGAPHGGTSPYLPDRTTCVHTILPVWPSTFSQVARVVRIVYQTSGKKVRVDTGVPVNLEPGPESDMSSRSSVSSPSARFSLLIYGTNARVI